MRRALSALAVLIVVVGAAAGLALAKGQNGSKQPALYASSDSTCAAGAQTTTGETYGSVLFNVTGKKGDKALVVVFKLRAAEVSTSYDLFVRQYEGGCDLAKVGTVTTNEDGNGTKQVRMAVVNGATTVWGEAKASGEPVLRTPAVALG